MNARIKELCRVMKGVDDHVERMENDRIAKMVYRGI